MSVMTSQDPSFHAAARSDADGFQRERSATGYRAMLQSMAGKVGAGLLRRFDAAKFTHVSDEVAGWCGCSSHHRHR